MVYKKYIKKNGKLYGPYIYHSHRVNGKVVSEYHGTDKLDYKKFVFFLFGILFLVLLLFLFFNFNGKITGKSISNSELNPQIQNSLDEEEITYPIVYFTLISRQIKNDVEETGEEQSETDSPIEEKDITEIEEPDESRISENQDYIGDIGSIEENVTEEPKQNESEETTTPTEEIIEQSTEQPPTQELTSSDTDSDTSEQQTEQPEEPTSEQSSEESGETTEATEQHEETPAPITGGVISRIFKTVSNFFLGLLKPTGMVTSEPIITEIKGEVSANESFIYNLKNDEGVELLSGSVKTDSKSLSDNVIQINYQDNQVLISTNYSEIVSNSVINQTTEINLTINDSINENFNMEPLTEEEKKILEEKLGNISVEIIKSELFNRRYIIKYGLGKYYIEYSYDADMGDEILNLQMENDKIKWLRDIIKELSREKTVSQPVDLS